MRSWRTRIVLFTDNFFNSHMLINKLYEKGIYCVWTVWRGRHIMAIMLNDNKHFSKHFVYFGKNILHLSGTISYNTSKILIILHKMKTITGISNETRNELTKYAILYQNVSIFYRQELASLFQVQEKLKT